MILWITSTNYFEESDKHDFVHLKDCLTGKKKIIYFFIGYPGKHSKSFDIEKESRVKTKTNMNHGKLFSLTVDNSINSF